MRCTVLLSSICPPRHPLAFSTLAALTSPHLCFCCLPQPPLTSAFHSRERLLVECAPCCRSLPASVAAALSATSAVRFSSLVCCCIVRSSAQCRRLSLCSHGALSAIVDHEHVRTETAAGVQTTHGEEKNAGVHRHCSGQSTGQTQCSIAADADERAIAVLAVALP